MSYILAEPPGHAIVGLEKIGQVGRRRLVERKGETALLATEFKARILSDRRGHSLIEPVEGEAAITFDIHGAEIEQRHWSSISTRVG